MKTNYLSGEESLTTYKNWVFVVEFCIFFFMRTSNSLWVKLLILLCHKVWALLKGSRKPAYKFCNFWLWRIRPLSAIFRHPPCFKTWHCWQLSPSWNLCSILQVLPSLCPCSSVSQWPWMGGSLMMMLLGFHTSFHSLWWSRWINWKSRSNFFRMRVKLFTTALRVGLTLSFL